MNQGISVNEVINRIQYVEASKADFVVPTTKMRMIDRHLEIDGTGTFGVNDLAHEQIGVKVKIPREYYKRMLKNEPELLARNVNTWFSREPERRLVRTLDGNVRAVLSDAYRPRENAIVAQSLLPILQMQPDLHVVSANVTEKNLYLKVLSRQLEGKIDVSRGGHYVGEVINGGISISNSEVGCGAFTVAFFAMVLSCMNGMIRENIIRAYHVGSRLGGGDNDAIPTFYTPEAIAADSRAFALKVRDTVAHAFDRKQFDMEIAKYNSAARSTVNVGRIEDVVENVTKRFTLNVDENKEVLGRFIQGGDLSQWGLANAVTNLANDRESYERSTQLEKIGGQIIDLKPGEWRSIACIQ